MSARAMKVRRSTSWVAALAVVVAGCGPVEAIDSPTDDLGQ